MQVVAEVADFQMPQQEAQVAVALVLTIRMAVQQLMELQTQVAAVVEHKMILALVLSTLQVGQVVQV